MTFERWLLGRVHDQGPTGDLARDYRDDPTRPSRLTHGYLDGCSACPEAHDALTAARAAWRAVHS